MSKIVKGWTRTGSKRTKESKRHLKRTRVIKGKLNRI